MLGVASPCLPSVRTSNDCNTLLKELQQIWSEIGETKAEKDRMLWELERECLEVYRRKMEEMVNVKAYLHQSVAAMEAELATLMAALGEINLHSTIQAEKNSASLKERLEAITPLVEDLRRKREDRVNQFADLKSQIEKISVEMSEYMNTTSNFTTLNITDEDLSLRKLTEYQTHLLYLQSEKVNFIINSHCKKRELKMLAVASPSLLSVRTSNDCNTLLKELQQIWSEIGETKAEKDRMLWELERECLEVYRRKVEEMVNVKTHLHQSVAAMEVELATLMAALGEINLHSTIQAEKNSASLKERLEAITPLVEDLRRKREDRVNQFADLKSQIEKISVEMSEYMSTTSNFTTLNITDEDLSLRKLTEYQTHLLSLQSEKSERLQKVLECMNKVHSLCDVLGFDFAKTVSEVHPSLGAIDGEQRTNISNTTLDGLEKAILRLEAECKVRVQKIRLKKEQEEKEKVEAHLYTIIKVARNEDLFEQIGKEIYFDLVDHDKVRSFRVQRQTLFQQFKEEVANAFGIPVQHQRFWLWAKRQNHTYRPNRPLTPQEEGQCVGQLREVSNKANTAELKLFLEVEFGWDLQPLPIPEKSKEDILLFFKLYDPSKEDLRYIGRLFLKKNSKPAEIMAKLNEMAGFSPDEEIELFEEIMFKPSVMCERVDEGVSFCASQIGDGDIICFQKSLKMESLRQYRYPDVPSFMEYVHNWLVVRFRSLEKPKEDEFSLELSKHHNYDDVVEMVSDHLGLEDPSKIRLTSHNCYSQQPKPQPIKYRGLERLSDMLVHYNQTSDILYYEVLDIPLPELQCLKTLKVSFHHATKDEVVVHTLRLPKQSTVGDMINDLKAKVEMSHPNADLRLLEIFYHKIFKIFPLNEKIENINDQYWTLRAEEIPEEEKNLGALDRLIRVYHFMKDPAQNQVSNFGEPFFLVIHEGETLSQIKVRIQKKLQVPDEEFAKWKFACLSLGLPDYLEDTDVLSAHFQRRDVFGALEQFLGLEHADTTPKRSYAVN